MQTAAIETDKLVFCGKFKGTYGNQVLLMPDKHSNYKPPLNENDDVIVLDSFDKAEHLLNTRN